MKVRLNQAWGQWSKGHVFTEMPGGQARTLITRGIAEEIKDPVVTETRALKAPVDRMMKAERRQLV
jgi:hypothetical protein